MKRIKAKLIGKGYDQDPFRVNLPNYTIDCKRDKDGNPIWIDITKNEAEDSCDYIKMECYVLVPDDEAKLVSGKWVLNQQKIRQKYKENWSNFLTTSVEP